MRILAVLRHELVEDHHDHIGMRTASAVAEDGDALELDDGFRIIGAMDSVALSEP